MQKCGKHMSCIGFSFVVRSPQGNILIVIYLVMSYVISLQQNYNYTVINLLQLSQAAMRISKTVYYALHSYICSKYRTVQASKFSWWLRFWSTRYQFPIYFNRSVQSWHKEWNRNLVVYHVNYWMIFDKWGDSGSIFMIKSAKLRWG